MIKKIVLAWFIMSMSFFSKAQQVLLEQDVKADEKAETWGPNQKYYMHGFIGYGFMAGAPQAAGSRIHYGLSHDWQFGLRFKLKVAEFYAIGVEGALNPQTFYIKQQPLKNLPDNVQHNSEKLKLTQIGLGFFNRINYGKRGNYVGNFIDAGLFGNWLPLSAHIYEDALETTNSPSGKKLKVKVNNLNFLTDFNYGLLTRLGFNRYVFYGNYRLSDLFNENQGKELAELPRLTVGIQVGMHK